MCKGVGLPVKGVIPTIEGVWIPVGEEFASWELRIAIGGGEMGSFCSEKVSGAGAAAKSARFGEPGWRKNVSGGAELIRC